jgi:hypothetical protein
VSKITKENIMNAVADTSLSRARRERQVNSSPECAFDRVDSAPRFKFEPEIEFERLKPALIETLRGPSDKSKSGSGSRIMAKAILYVLFAAGTLVLGGIVLLTLFPPC